MIKMRKWHTIFILALMACAAGTLLFLYNQRVVWDSYEYKGNLVKTKSTLPVMDNPVDAVEPAHNLAAGTRVAVTGDYEGWYYIHTKSGKEGWVKKIYVVGIVKVQDIIDARNNFKLAVEEQKKGWKQ
jgi:hypothetical protein